MRSASLVQREVSTEQVDGGIVNPPPPRGAPRPLQPSFWTLLTQKIHPLPEEVGGIYIILSSRSHCQHLRMQGDFLPFGKQKAPTKPPLCKQCPLVKKKLVILSEATKERSRRIYTLSILQSSFWVRRSFNSLRSLRMTSLT